MKKKRLRKGIHTFVICAYKESAYLEECVLSLKNQTISSEILMITSTPNDHIEKIATKYNIPLIINYGDGGIAQDWNFGIKQCKSRFITIAHQDDTYEEDYLEQCLNAIRKSKKPLIAFTDYGEIRKSEKISKSRLLFVKKCLLLPMRVSAFRSSTFVKRRILSLGNPICCPSVTFCMEQLEKPIFEVKYGSNLDWQTWAQLAKKQGEFVYVPKQLMYHRIHQESTTSNLIENHERGREDEEMLRSFWPAWIANIIAKFYAKGERLNDDNEH